ncbi:MAG: SH3 domain-containing protein [Desulfurivibrionaceae bacterium]|nr:SH3 domain-containing protein [Desulfobulbales bacterium]MDT8335445.1 SH3 domain-containing protein [Desulfurivibrionaceae bacterium]
MLRQVVFTLFLFLSTLAAAEAISLVSVDGENVNMRSGPGSNYSVLWELGRGFPLKILGRKGDWVKVEDFEGDSGWIYGKLVAKNPHLIVKKKRINVRSGPGRNYRLVGKANYGVVFQTIEHSKGWVKVKHENGLAGWVKRDLLWGW